MNAWSKNGATRILAIFVCTCFIIAVGIAIVSLLPYGRVTYSDKFSSALIATTTGTQSVPTKSVSVVTQPIVTHLATPEPLKGLYMTACTASVSRLREAVLKNFQGTELNAIVVDLKDYTGTDAYASTTLQVGAAIGRGCRILDLPRFLADLHSRGIYIIARITVFQDPLYSSLYPNLAIRSLSRPGDVWRDKSGLSYLDPGAKPYWDYIASIGREAYSIGFDELNFDYIRYPSDGNLKDMSFTWSSTTPKSHVMKSFFKYLNAEFSSTSPQGRVPISADIFGLTTSADDDMGIGQVLTDVLPYFDYVSPMVYPSHFAKGYIGITKPATQPYAVIKYSMSQAVARAIATTTTIKAFGDALIASTTPKLYTKIAVDKHKLRPWLQAFDLGAIYTPDMVHAQIQATYDAGLSSWLLWNAASIYNKDEVMMKSTLGVSPVAHPPSTAEASGAVSTPGHSL